MLTHMYTFQEQKLTDKPEKKLTRPKSAGRVKSSGEKKQKVKGKFKRPIPDPLFVNRDDNLLDESPRSAAQPENPSEPAAAEKVARKPQRPSSAPVRRFKQAEVEKLISPQSPSAKKDGLRAKADVPPGNYTYDLNGRKVLLSEEELESIRRRHMKLAENIIDDPIDSLKKVHKVSRREQLLEDIVNNKPIASSIAHPAGPTIAAWPSKTTERSAEEYVKKQIDARNLEKGVKESIQPKPRMFGAYEKMTSMDLIFSIEHCHNCQFHNISLRHDPLEYINHADTLLRILARVCHDNRICSRVGVIRFGANVTSKSRQTDIDHRIGAFEVQVAYRNKAGILHTELLHSKLFRRSWPSKSVVEKRLQSFFSRVAVPRYDEGISIEDSDYESSATGGLAEYPVGIGPWSSTALASDTWKYPGSGTADSPNANVGISESVGDRIDNDIPNVQWVFDSRIVVSETRKFPVGSTVWVSGISNSRGIIERQSLLGVVKKLVPNSHRLVIKLKYQTEEIEVGEDNCKSISEHKGPNLTFTDVQLPLEIVVVLQIAISLGPLTWEVLDSDDKEIVDDETGVRSIFLSRHSFFNQIRALAADVELKCKESGDYKIKHEASNSLIDAQIAYSEVCIDKVYEIFGGRLVNMTKLAALVSGASFLPAEPLTSNFTVPPQHPDSRPNSARSGTFSTHNLRYADELVDAGSSLYLSPMDRVGLNQTESPFPYLADSQSIDAFQVSSDNSGDLTSNPNRPLDSDDAPPGVIFNGRQLTFIMLDLSGEVLQKDVFDKFSIEVSIYSELSSCEVLATFATKNSSTSEARSSRRQFHVNSEGISIPANAFGSGKVVFNFISVDDSEVDGSSIMYASIRLHRLYADIGPHSVASVSLQALDKEGNTVLLKVQASLGESSESKSLRIQGMHGSELARHIIVPLSDDEDDDIHNTSDLQPKNLLRAENSIVGRSMGGADESLLHDNSADLCQSVMLDPDDSAVREESPRQYIADTVQAPQQAPSIGLLYDKHSRPTSAVRPGSAARSSRATTPREATQQMLDDLNYELNGGNDLDGYDNDDFEEV